MKHLLYQSEQPFSLSNLKMSKEVTITSINESKNSKLISMLKKLPDITFNYITPQPVFKVPETPKYKKKVKKKFITHESKVMCEKKLLSENQDNNIMDKNPKIRTKTLNDKQRKINNNNIPLLGKNNFNQIITNRLKSAAKKYLSSEQENIQRTSSPIKLLKKPQSISMIKSKTVEPIKEVPNTTNVSHEVTKIADNDSIIKNTDVKINKSSNENYTLMDISTKDEIDIVPASHSLGFINACVPEYGSFVEGIDKLTKYNSYIETSQDSIETESSLVGQELTSFSDILSHIKTSIVLNNSDSIHTELDSRTYSIEGKAFIDNIQNEQLYVNINKFKKAEYEVNESENEEKSNSKNTPVVLKDIQLLQEIKNSFCDNLVEKPFKNQLGYCTKSLQKISPNTIEDYTVLQTNKRHGLTQNYLNKKQKSNNENKN